MANALTTSRDFLHGAVARVRSGLDQYDENIKMQGQDIPVEPFDAQNVSTPAAFIKLGTSIAASQRKKANLQAGMENVELERDKTRAEIALLRAQEQFNLGAGRQTSQPKDTGLTDYQKEQIRIADERTAIARGRAGRGASRSQRLTAARAWLKENDAQINRDVAQKVAHGMQTAEPTFQRIMTSGNNATDKDLMDVGIDPSSWDAQSDENRSTMLQNARTALAKRYEPGYRRQVSDFFAPKRSRYSQIVEQLADPDYQELDSEGADILGLEGVGDYGGGGGSGAPSDIGDSGGDQGVVDLVIDAAGNLVPAGGAAAPAPMAPDPRSRIAQIRAGEEMARGAAVDEASPSDVTYSRYVRRPPPAPIPPPRMPARNLRTALNRVPGLYLTGQ